MGITAPILITVKIIFSEVSGKKQQWNENISSNIKEKWITCIRSLSKIHTVSILSGVATNSGSRVHIHILLTEPS